MTAATAEPRLGFYRDGDMVSRCNTRDLKLPADWVLFPLGDGSVSLLFLKGSEKHAQHMQELMRRNQRDALRLFEDDEDSQ